MQVILLAFALATTSTTSGGLFSDEPIPDKPGDTPASGGLFSDEPIPDAPGDEAPGATSGGGLFGGGAIPDAPPDSGLFDAVAEPEFDPRIRVSIALDALAAVDTSHDHPNENIFELHLGGKLVVDADFDFGLTIYTAPRFLHVTAINRAGDDREFTYLDVPEAHLTWGFGRTHLRFGTQVFNWGTSDFSAPADILNPVDLRRGALNSSDPSSAKIPVLAAEVVTGFGPVTLRGVVQPFFTSSKFFISGWDDSLTTGLSSGMSIPDLSALLGPGTADRIGSDVVITDRPEDRPDNATFGGRATLDLGTADISATAIYGWGTLPRIEIEPTLAAGAGQLLGAFASNEPIDPFQLAPIFDAVEKARQEGRPIFAGTYERRLLFGVDAAIAVDPVILKFDVAYTFDRTLYTQDFRPKGYPWLNATVGLEYLDGEDLQILVELFAMTVFDVRSNERLQIIEPVAPPPSSLDLKGRTISMPGAIGVIRYNVLDGDLAFEAALVSTFHRGDIVFAPTIRYRIDDHNNVSLGGLLIEGKRDGYGGLYTHNDRVQVAYTWSL